MRSVAASIPALAAAAMLLAGCGADSHANWPKALRQPDPPPPPPAVAPDVKKLVRDNIAKVFVASARPSNVVVSPARRDLHGLGWTACVKASVSGISNQPLGPQTYVVTIENDRIWDRHRAGADDGCEAETYEPL